MGPKREIFQMKVSKLSLDSWTHLFSPCNYFRSSLKVCESLKVKETLSARLWRLVARLWSPSPRNYLRTGSISQSPPRSPDPRIKYKFANCSQSWEYSDGQLFIVCSSLKNLGNKSDLLSLRMRSADLKTKTFPLVWLFSWILNWPICASEKVNHQPSSWWPKCDKLSLQKVERAFDLFKLAAQQRTWNYLRTRSMPQCVSCTQHESPCSFKTEIEKC